MWIGHHLWIKMWPVFLFASTMLYVILFCNYLCSNKTWQYKRFPSKINKLFRQFWTLLGLNVQLQLIVVATLEFNYPCNCWQMRLKVDAVWFQWLWWHATLLTHQGQNKIADTFDRKKKTLLQTVHMIICCSKEPATSAYVVCVSLGRLCEFVMLTNVAGWRMLGQVVGCMPSFQLMLDPPLVKHISTKSKWNMFSSERSQCVKISCQPLWIKLIKISVKYETCKKTCLSTRVVSTVSADIKSIFVQTHLHSQQWPSSGCVYKWDCHFKLIITDFYSVLLQSNGLLMINSWGHHTPCTIIMSWLRILSALLAICEGGFNSHLKIPHKGPLLQRALMLHLLSA